MQLPVEIGKLSVADLDRVMEIEEVSFRHPWPRAFFVNDLASPQSICLGGWVENQLIAYGVAMVASVELHITNIAVHQDRQRRGLGTRIIAELEGEGKRRGCSYAYLEVRVSNQSAVELYRKLGYGFAYSRRGYYLDGEDAHVMEKIL